MQDNMIITFKDSTVENLHTYSQLLKKDVNTMLEEALTMYFEYAQQMLLKQGMGDDNMMTSLDYDEFWDGVEL